MTKPHTERPIKEIRFVKPAGDTEVYEYWIMVPQYLGSVQRHGQARLTTQDGAGPFSNHKAALFHLLQHNEHKDMLDSLSVWVKTPKSTKSFLVPGTKIVAQDKWKAFCELKGINPKDEDAMKKFHKITLAEVEQLGLEVDG
jgi:hypothetical protein